MSMLARYKKQPNGFETLLTLIEQCNKKKQDQLLGLIEAEDVVWAKRVRDKMLTVERVINLPQDALNEIFSRVSEKILVFALHGVTPEKREQIMATFNHFKKKSVSELINGSKATPQETEAAFLAIFKKIRDLDKERTISLEKLAPELSLKEEKKKAS